MNDSSLDGTAFAASFLSHVVGILALAMLDCIAPVRRAAMVLLPPVADVCFDDPQTFPEIENFDSKITVISHVEALPGVVTDQNPPHSIPIPAPEPEVGPLNEFDRVAVGNEPAPSWLVEPFDTDKKSIENSTDAHASVASVIDRLTAEIQKTARYHPTRVVWLFDASVSLTRQRAEVGLRLEKVLGELHADVKLQPLEHLVCGFGRTLGPITSFTSDQPEAANRAVRAIPIDDAGIENTFSAISGILDEHTPPARVRRTLIIVFTDEVGNDADRLDQVLTAAHRKTATVYVVGPVAPFGEDTATMAFFEPDARFDQTPRDVQIEQGPETAFRMTLNIVTGTLDTQAIDSGFGSYALTRLCHETNGCYLALHPDRRPGHVDVRATSALASRIIWFAKPAAMAPYRPDYRPWSIQDRESRTHVAKQALRTACSLPRLDLLIDLKTIFDAPDQGRFAQEVFAAQQPAAAAGHKIGVIYEILKQGAQAAKQLEEPRWRASYDLAMGRTLAIKTKFEAYNRLLGNAKSGLRATRPDTNRWRLEPSHDLHCQDGALERQADTARDYLMRVVREHPGTPWALVAQQVLEEPLGYRWVEDQYDPPLRLPKPAAPPPDPPKPQDDPARPRLVPKPQRDSQRI